MARPGDAAFDATLPFPVVRHRRGLVLPEPSVARAAASVARSESCEAVWVAAAAPLGLLAPALRRRGGVDRVVATTHGHEIWWARLPGSRAVLHRVGEVVDTLTVLGPWTRAALEPALSGAARHRIRRLTPGVDTAFFAPSGGPGKADVRARLGLADRPVVVCVSRLVPRKGQDTLIRALPRIAQAVPDVALLLVGGGGDRKRLEHLARDLDVQDGRTPHRPGPLRGTPGALRGG